MTLTELAKNFIDNPCDDTYIQLRKEVNNTKITPFIKTRGYACPVCGVRVKMDQYQCSRCNQLFTWKTIKILKEIV